MPRSRREHRERTHDWQTIQQYTLWSGQKAYELLRLLRNSAKETGASECTLCSKVSPTALFQLLVPHAPKYYHSLWYQEAQTYRLPFTSPLSSAHSAI